MQNSVMLHVNAMCQCCYSTGNIFVYGNVYY